jgi:MFS family permease
MDTNENGAGSSIPRDYPTTGSAALRRRTAILTIILVSYLMIALGTSIVITALPNIQQSPGFSPIGLSWVQNAYTLAFGGFLLLGARAGDVLVTVFAAAGSLSRGARAALTHRISTSLAAGSAMLAIALTVILALIVRRVKNAEGRARAAGGRRLAAPA